jgi:tetratricopeptide (TPR) repeat protein
MHRRAWVTFGLLLFAAAVLSATALRRCSSRDSGPTSESTTASLARAAGRAWRAADYVGVIRLLRQVPAGDAFEAQSQVFQGRALSQLFRWRAAEDVWNYALALDEKVPEAGWELLELCSVLQRTRDSEELVLRLYSVEANPRGRAELLLELVRQEYERLSPGDTVLALEPVVTTEPENCHALRVLGLSYVQLGRVSDGLPLVQRAIELRPEDPDNWFTFAWCLYETGDIDRLGRVWDAMPAAVRQDARLLRYRGMWAERLMDWQESERAYRAALERDPADRKAHYQLARVLRRRGADDEANEHEKAARELDETREALASCYTRATQQKNDPPAELCREFSRLCRALGRPRQAALWDEETNRRS